MTDERDRDEVLIRDAEGEVVRLRTEASDPDGNPVYSLTCDGLLSQVELLAVAHEIMERFGKRHSASAVARVKRGP